MTNYEIQKTVEIGVPIAQSLGYDGDGSIADYLAIFKPEWFGADYTQIAMDYRAEQDNVVYGWLIKAKELKLIDYQIPAPSQEDLYEYGDITLDEVKANQKQVIANSFNACYSNGKNLSLGWKISCNYTDLANMQSLEKYMTAMQITQTYVADYDGGMHLCTLSQVSQIVMELIGYGLQMYGHKWEKETEINNAQTYEAVVAIVWSLPN